MQNQLSQCFQQLKCSGLEKRASGGRRACREVGHCPPGCSCTESGPEQMVVDCHDRQLRAVPDRLPPHTVELLGNAKMPMGFAVFQPT